MASSGIRFGAGITYVVGMDLAALGARNVLVITDAVLAVCGRSRSCSSRRAREALPDA